LLSWLANAWRVPELRRRVLFTAFILAVYRFGSWVPAPGVNPSALSGLLGGGVFGLLSLFSGGSLGRLSVFALSIMPYVTSSIVIQLLSAAVPSLEQLKREGEAGQAKITQYTRYGTVGLAAAQATGYVYLFSREGLALDTGRKVLVVVTWTAGCCLLMWMGEQITKRGIGNGISILIFASILTSAPTGINAWLNGTPVEKLFLPIVVLGVIVAVVFVQEGQRRIPIQYAKRMVGRRQMGGQSTYMPLRVNMAGVIPVIFAAAVLALPQTLGSFFPQWQSFINQHLTQRDWTYLIIEALLIVVFTFFYTSVTFNPVDQADELRKYGGYIPGIRPGPPTAIYLDRVLTRLTLPGSLFLATVALIPSIVVNQFNFSQNTYRFLGGTSVLIVVGVALDTMRQMESQMMMRSYEGFLR
jgi:preprotein translocase subunit SecY